MTEKICAELSMARESLDTLLELSIVTVVIKVEHWKINPNHCIKHTNSSHTCQMNFSLC